MIYIILDFIKDNLFLFIASISCIILLIVSSSTMLGYGFFGDGVTILRIIFLVVILFMIGSLAYNAIYYNKHKKLKATKEAEETIQKIVQYGK